MRRNYYCIDCEKLRDADKRNSRNVTTTTKHCTQVEASTSAANYSSVCLSRPVFDENMLRDYNSNASIAKSSRRDDEAIWSRKLSENKEDEKRDFQFFQCYFPPAVATQDVLGGRNFPVNQRMNSEECQDVEQNERRCQHAERMNGLNSNRGSDPNSNYDRHQNDNYSRRAPAALKGADYEEDEALRPSSSSAVGHKVDEDDSPYYDNVPAMDVFSVAKNRRLKLTLCAESLRDSINSGENYFAYEHNCSYGSPISTANDPHNGARSSTDYARADTIIDEQFARLFEMIHCNHGDVDNLYDELERHDNVKVADRLRNADSQEIFSPVADIAPTKLLSAVSLPSYSGCARCIRENVLRSASNSQNSSKNNAEMPRGNDKTFSASDTMGTDQTDTTTTDSIDDGVNKCTPIYDSAKMNSNSKNIAPSLATPPSSCSAHNKNNKIIERKQRNDTVDNGTEYDSADCCEVNECRVAPPSVALVFRKYRLTTQPESTV